MLDTSQKDLAWTVFGAVDLGVAVLDCDRRVVAWNAWLASASAISRETAIGARFDDLFPEGSVSHVSLAVTASLESGTSRLLSQSLHPKLLPLKTRSGQDMIHDATVRAVDYPPNRYCLIQVFDVSVAVKRDRLLRERQNARYDAVVDSAPDVILTLDDEDTIQFANPAADRQFGYAAKELIGRPAAHGTRPDARSSTATPCASPSKLWPGARMVRRVILKSRSRAGLASRAFSSPPFFAT